MCLEWFRLTTWRYRSSDWNTVMQIDWLIEVKKLYPKKKKVPTRINCFGIWSFFFKLKAACYNPNQFPLVLFKYSIPAKTQATLPWMCTFFSPYSFLTLFLDLEWISRYHWENPLHYSRSNSHVSHWMSPARSNSCLFCASRILILIQFNWSFFL